MNLYYEEQRIIGNEQEKTIVISLAAVAVIVLIAMIVLLNGRPSADAENVSEDTMIEQVDVENDSDPHGIKEETVSTENSEREQASASHASDEAIAYEKPATAERPNNTGNTDKQEEPFKGGNNQGKPVDPDNGNGGNTKPAPGNNDNTTPTPGNDEQGTEPQEPQEPQEPGESTNQSNDDDEEEEEEEEITGQEDAED